MESEHEQRRPTISKSQFERALKTVLDKTYDALSGTEYRIVGTGAALLRGLQLPVGDIDILLKDRFMVDKCHYLMAEFDCVEPPHFIEYGGGGQYYTELIVDDVEVGFSTVEFKTDSDGIECYGTGPWTHYSHIRFGGYTVPVVNLELRLVSELVRNRPDRYIPIFQYMRGHRHDTGIVSRGLQAGGAQQALISLVENILGKTL